MERIHEIHIKGSFPSIHVETVLKRAYVDLSKRQYGKVIFKGTEQEFDNFYDKFMPKSETYVKDIGYKSFNLENYDQSGKVIFTKEHLR